MVGIVGGVVAGVAADLTRRSDLTCVVMLFCATPTLIMYQVSFVMRAGLWVRLWVVW